MSPRRDLIIRELVAAMRSLQAAYEQARILGDEELANALRKTASAIGAHISAAQRSAAREARLS